MSPHPVFFFFFFFFLSPPPPPPQKKSFFFGHIFLFFWHVSPSPNPPKQVTFLCSHIYLSLIFFLTSVFCTWLVSLLFLPHLERLVPLWDGSWKTMTRDFWSSWSSHCGGTGLVAALLHHDTGSIPRPLTSVDGHLGCFHISAPVNDAAKNTGAHVIFLN